MVAAPAVVAAANPGMVFESVININTISFYASDGLGPVNW